MHAVGYLEPGDAWVVNEAAELTRIVARIIRNREARVPGRDPQPPRP